GLVAHVVETAAVGLPQRPEVAAVVVEDLSKALLVQIIKPDLAGLRAVLSLAPPGRALPGEKQPPAIRRQAAVLAIFIQDGLIRLTLAAVDREEALGVAPEVVAAATDQELRPIAPPPLQRVAGRVESPLPRAAA